MRPFGISVTCLPVRSTADAFQMPLAAVAEATG